MIRALGTIATCFSVVLFPWPYTAILALLVSLSEPLVPFVAGLLADTLYYSPHGGAWPLLTIYGLFTTLIIFLVRDTLKTSSIGA